jgi:hypothetical protein
MNNTRNEESPKLKGIRTFCKKYPAETDVLLSFSPLPLTPK